MYPFMQRIFGVEIEVSDTQPTIRNLLDDIPNFKFKNRTCDFHSTGRNWDLKPEISTGCEIASPTMKKGDENHIKLRSVLNKIASTQVTDEDGLHVHVHVPDIERERLYIAWLSIELAMVNMFPKHRKYNEHIQLYITKYRTNKILSHYITKDSYNDVHFHNSSMSMEWWDERKSIEFRLHEGTIDNVEVNNWIDFILHFVEYARTVDIIKLLGQPPTRDPMRLSTMLNLPYPLIRWVDKRSYLYNCSK